MNDVGFTGTQGGITPRQSVTLANLLRYYNREWLRGITGTRVHFHHGCCVGADYNAHLMARALGYWVVGHPPIKKDKVPRFFQYQSQSQSQSQNDSCDVMHDAQEYLVRNHNIVDAVGVVLACPRTVEEEIRSGTWATVRYARKIGKEVKVIGPDGVVR